MVKALEEVGVIAQPPAPAPVDAEGLIATIESGLRDNADESWKAIDTLETELERLKRHENEAWSFVPREEWEWVRNELERVREERELADARALIAERRVVELDRYFEDTDGAIQRAQATVFALEDRVNELEKALREIADKPWMAMIIAQRMLAALEQEEKYETTS